MQILGLKIIALFALAAMILNLAMFWLEKLSSLMYK